MKNKKKLQKGKKTELSQTQKPSSSTDDYSVGCVANFLGTSHTSQPGNSTLSAFFQPSNVIEHCKVKDALPNQAKKPTPAQSKKSDSSLKDKTIADNAEVRTSLKRARNSATTSSQITPITTSTPEEDDVDEGEPRLKKKRTFINPSSDPLVDTRTVFVGNLPVNTTKKEVKGLFKTYGVIESIRFRSMALADPSASKKVAAIKQELHPNRSSFNAYVVYKDEQSAKSALDSNGKKVGKHHIRVDIAGSSKKHDMTRSVFIGNVPFNVEEEEIRDYFVQCGPIEAVRLIRDKKTGLGKGFGYILFKDSYSVQFALKRDGSNVSGRALRVRRAVKKEKQKYQRDQSYPRKPFATAKRKDTKRKDSKAQTKPGYQEQRETRRSRPKVKGKKKQKGKKGR